MTHGDGTVKKTGFLESTKSFGLYAAALTVLAAVLLVLGDYYSTPLFMVGLAVAAVAIGLAVIAVAWVDVCERKWDTLSLAVLGFQAAAIVAVVVASLIIGHPVPSSLS